MPGPATSAETSANKSLETQGECFLPMVFKQVHVRLELPAAPSWPGCTVFDAIGGETSCQERTGCSTSGVPCKRAFCSKAVSHEFFNVHPGNLT